jgi:uncharacterized protein
MNSEPVETKHAHLRSILETMERVVVAFSGGVDSSLLLRVAVDTLGARRVLAVIGDSESLPRQELADAQSLADMVGVPYRVIKSEEMRDPEYRANSENRCYFCKRALFAALARLAAEEGFALVLDGSNADDLGDWRPGLRAARECGVRSPLQEANLSKAEVRELSRRLGLPTAEKPAMACLASRLPYGTPVTPEALSKIEKAEAMLRELGLGQVRVRLHGDLARIEILPEGFPQLLVAPARERVLAALAELGFRYVCLDLQGYRSGSMNPA